MKPPRGIATIIIISMLTGCAPKYAYDNTDKMLMASMVATQIADGHTTSRALENPNNMEANPLLGRNPSDSQIIITKVIATGIILWLASKMEPKQRKLTLGVVSTLTGAVAIRNNSLR